MKLIKYVPNFVDDESREYDITSKEELLNNEWVQRVSKSVGDDIFYRLSISKKGEFDILMVEYNDGYLWYVVAFLSGDRANILKDFPSWKPRYKSGNKEVKLFKDTFGMWRPKRDENGSLEFM